MKPEKAGFVSIVAISIVFSVSQFAFGYGKEGHELVGAIADNLIKGTPTEKQVADLLFGIPLQEAAHFPDDIKAQWDSIKKPDKSKLHLTGIKKLDEDLADFFLANPPRPKAGQFSHHIFHYTDVPVTGNSTYATAPVGTNDHDIVHMIPICFKVLQKQALAPDEAKCKISESVAVILIAHYLGDIHQPLHVGAEYFDENEKNINPNPNIRYFDDTGGLDIFVKFVGHHQINHSSLGTALHPYWDDQTVNAVLRNIRSANPNDHRPALDVAATQLSAKQPANMPKVDIQNAKLAESWADEILPLAREAHTRLKYLDVEFKTNHSGKVTGITVAAEEISPSTDGKSYDDWAAEKVQEKIQLAGWRLAEVLKQALPGPNNH